MNNNTKTPSVCIDCGCYTGPGVSRIRVGCLCPCRVHDPLPPAFSPSSSQQVANSITANLSTLPTLASSNSRKDKKLKRSLKDYKKTLLSSIDLINEVIDSLKL